MLVEDLENLRGNLHTLLQLLDDVTAISACFADTLKQSDN